MVLAYFRLLFIPESSLPVILFGIVLVAITLWLGWLTLDWTNDYAVVTNRRVVKLEKVLLLYESRQEVPLDAILADDLKTDQIGRILDYGNIIVRTYTGVIVLNRLAHPQIDHQPDQRSARTEKDPPPQRATGYRSTAPSASGWNTCPAKKERRSRARRRCRLKLARCRNSCRNFSCCASKKMATLFTAPIGFCSSKKLVCRCSSVLFLLIGVILIWLNVIPFGVNTGTWLLLLLGPAFFLWLLYQYVDWRNDRYIITPELIIDVFKKPLGTEEKKSAPLRNILSIDYERRNLVGIVFNFGTVFIRVGESTFTFDNVINPAEVQREVFQAFMNLKQRDEDRQEQERTSQMADWIERYHNYREGTTEQNPLEDIPGDEEPGTMGPAA